jgi:dihydrofolate reductase
LPNPGYYPEKAAHMKKINIIAIIGKNNSYGCPLYTNNQAFDGYIKSIVDDGILVINDRICDKLPGKSPPFPCHDTYIISHNKKIVDSNLPRTWVVDSLLDVFALVENSDKAVFIFVDDVLYKELLPNHFGDIDTIIVGQLDMPFKNKRFFEPPSPFQWRPLLLDSKKSGGKRSPGFTVHRYQKSDFHL